MVENGRLKLGGLPIPFVQSAALSARYRARVDPAYYLREHYRHIYDANHRSDLSCPGERISRSVSRSESRQGWPGYALDADRLPTDCLGRV